MTTTDVINIDEEVFGAASSGYPINHITAGDIDSGKMIEGLDPRKATITECQRAMAILQKHCVLKVGSYGQTPISVYNDGNKVVVQYGGDASREDIAFDMGKISAAIPPFKSEYDRYSRAGDFGGRGGKSALIVDSTQDLAIGINALAKAAGTNVLDEISMIQDYERNGFRGC